MTMAVRLDFQSKLLAEGSLAKDDVPDCRIVDVLGAQTFHGMWLFIHLLEIPSLNEAILLCGHDRSAHFFNASGDSGGL